MSCNGDDESPPEIELQIYNALNQAYIIYSSGGNL